MPNPMESIVNAFNTRMPQLDCMAHNIANIHTPGYKTERLFYLVEHVEDPFTRERKLSYIPKTCIDFTPGAMQQTGNPLDMALQGEGFFAVRSPEGEIYTRRGNFTLNRNNELVTQEGYYVLGESGPITIQGVDIKIGEKGGISADGTDVGKLKIVRFKNKEALSKRQGCYFENSGENPPVPEPDPEPGVRSGNVENSNVQALREMIEMINIQRSIESYQKVILTLGDQDKLSTNRLGKL
ncbi:MAG TPA: flagellar basal-body rod protein FlgF [Syntrophales bacterium]|nr:flagellar basal-body rod protein FlgF [Syntrophales bacterium]